MLERIAIFGASRGLGAALAGQWIEQKRGPCWLTARNIAKSVFVGHNLVTTYSCDLAKPESFLSVADQMLQFQPHRIVYAAGGGPYGLFEEKNWNDHLWALELNLLRPMQLIHFALQNLKNTQQVVLIGSAIAEAQEDPLATSYSVSKHALKSLIYNLRAEKKSLDVRLYSPGYMDTPLLPKNAWPRKQGLVLSPSSVAQDLYRWMHEQTEEFHRIYQGGVRSCP